MLENQSLKYKEDSLGLDSWNLRKTVYQIGHIYMSYLSLYIYISFIFRYR